jgi:hypothetical protein
MCGLMGLLFNLVSDDSATESALDFFGVREFMANSVLLKILDSSEFVPADLTSKTSVWILMGGPHMLKSTRYIIVELYVENA